MLELRALQEAFWSAITAPEGVPEAVALGVERARLEVYANMYFYRLRDNLALDFPVLAELLGPAGFHNLITDYLLAHPSRDPNVRYVGRALPGFLAGWHAELAALEWARVDVFGRADEPLLCDLSAHARLGFAQLSLRLVEAHALVHVQHAVEPIWRTRRGSPARAAHAILVWRQGTAVHHRPLDADEATLWPELQRGLSFIALCGQLALPLEQAAQRALQLVMSWTASELLVDVS